MIIAPTEIKTYIRCSEFYHLGGRDEQTLFHKMITYLLTSLMAKRIRKDKGWEKGNLASDVARLVLKLDLHKTMLEQEINDLVHRLYYAMDAIFTDLPSSTHVVVSGFLEYKIPVSRSFIEIQQLGILRKTYSAELIVPYISPYKTVHDMMNDPLLYFQLKHTGLFGKPSERTRPLASIHCYSIQETGKVNVLVLKHNEILESRKDQIVNIVKGIENGIHYPVTPCTFACPFKNVNNLQCTMKR